jgi:L-fuconolactonase
MAPDDPILARPYGPTDLTPHLAAAGVDRTVLVQAAPTVHETEYMLGVADATDHVAAVVGWVDFERPEDRAHLDRLHHHPKFVGVRPMIQDIPDVDWMLRPDVQWAYEAVTELGLTFDALGFPQHLPNFLTVLTRHRDMRAVVDHCMKPQIRDHSPDWFRPWAEGMSLIARETGVYCKLSGLVTEAGEAWTIDALRPYADHVLEAFGPSRVMWGSDWPVCRLRCEYDAWWSAAQTLTAALSEADKARIFGGTAIEFYGLAADATTPLN